MSAFSQNGYYVAPDGDDNNPGSIKLPWKTWGKAFNASVIQPGDTVYFRGGVYYKDPRESVDNPTWFYPPGGTGYKIASDGEVGDTIYYYAYPPDLKEGNKPILDCINWIHTDPDVGFYGIRSPDVNYSKFYGLTVRNVLYADVNIPTQCFGWLIYGTGVVIENCVIYNCSGAGLAIDGGGTDFHVINCDAYNMYDPQHPTQPGETGSGFRNHNFSSGLDGSVYFENCRAWYCSDQGFSSASYSYVEYEGCWSFLNGKCADPNFINEAGGHGFKFGIWYTEEELKLRRYYHNNLAAFNRISGFTTNDHNYLAHGKVLHNNIAYHNGYYSDMNSAAHGFRIFNTISTDEWEMKRVFINNISYANEHGEIIVGTGAVYTHEYNSWDYPGGITITDADFISLDSTGLAGPRQLDGSLPDIDFLKLAPGSKLIDAGTNVGLPYSGDAPDLGAREYVEPGSNMHPSVKISAPDDNTKADSPATFNITVSASDPDGSIRKVELFNGTESIGEKNAPPWNFTWNNVEPGTYSIKAVATDNEGAASTSAPVTLVVENKPEWKTNPDLIALYPNPNNGNFTITWKDPMQSEYCNLNISTQDGRSVYYGYMLSEELPKQFNLSWISPGLYILVLSGKNIITTKKFIKE